MPVQGLEPRFSKPKNDSKDHPSVIHRTFWKQRSPNKRLSECVYSSLLELFFKRFFGPSFSTSTQPCVNLSTFRLKRCQQKQPRVVSGPETPPEKHQQGVYVRVYIYICTYFKKKYIYIYSIHIIDTPNIKSLQPPDTHHFLRMPLQLLRSPHWEGTELRFNIQPSCLKSCCYSNSIWLCRPTLIWWLFDDTLFSRNFKWF